MTITIDPLNKTSLTTAEKMLKKYIKNLPQKCEKIAQRLSNIGSAMADSVFGNAVYDLDMDGVPRGNPGISVFVEGPAVSNGKIVYTIIADGWNVAFVEFGAGVYYNSGGDPYHETRPEGIVGIGEYGRGSGKREWWAFKAPEHNGDTYMTHGTPEQPGMYLASKAMRDSLEQIAIEVFKDD